MLIPEFCLPVWEYPACRIEKVSEEFRRLNPEIPIILMTGWRSEPDPERRKEPGIRKVLSKPVHRVDILSSKESVTPSQNPNLNRGTRIHHRRHFRLWPPFEPHDKLIRYNRPVSFLSPEPRMEIRSCDSASPFQAAWKV